MPLRKEVGEEEHGKTFSFLSPFSLFVFPGIELCHLLHHEWRKHKKWNSEINFSHIFPLWGRGSTKRKNIFYFIMKKKRKKKKKE